MIWERRHSRRFRILRHPRHELHPRSCPGVMVFVSRGWGVEGEIDIGSAAKGSPTHKEQNFDARRQTKLDARGKKGERNWGGA